MLNLNIELRTNVHMGPTALRGIRTTVETWYKKSEINVPFTFREPQFKKKVEYEIHYI